MTSCRLNLMLAAIAVALAGCTSGAGTYQTLRMASDDYGRAFEVTRQVLDERFVIERSDPGSGVIVTSPRTVEPSDSVLDTVLDIPGNVRNARRIASAQVSRANGSTKVSVKVQLEVAQTVQSAPRPTYSEYDPTATGAESDIYRQPEERQEVFWKKAGSDTQMENELLAEIERRLKSAAPAAVE